MGDPRQASELLKLLDIEFDEITSTRVRGSIAADERHHQPWGIVHGGLYTAVIEAFASTGAFGAVIGSRPASRRAFQRHGLPASRPGPAGFRSSPSRSSRDAPNSYGRSRSAAQTTTS